MEPFLPRHLVSIVVQPKTVKNTVSPVLIIGILLLILSITGCNRLSRITADAQQKPPRSTLAETTPSVDVAIAKTGVIQDPLEYTGKTEPVREISLRSQIEARLLKLNVDVGDAVKQGQILAQLDETLLVTAVTQAEAELVALQSQVAQATAQVGNAKAQAEQARLNLQQAKVDAARMERLAKAGAISKQQAELAQTAAATAEQTLEAAIKQIRTQEDSVAAAKGRVKAQQAVMAQTKERQSYTLLASPINGVVLERLTQPGNLITSGSEVLKLGDFSRVKVRVSVSDLELSDLQVGQAVTVQLDAFENNTFPGTITRISPAANPQNLTIPIEVTIPNTNGRIGSGLLARVSFSSTTAARVIVPETALQVAEETEKSATGKENHHQSQFATVFVVMRNGSEGTVTARAVKLGDRINQKVEILSGLQPGEQFVVQSSAKLKNGDTVRFSRLSE